MRPGFALPTPSRSRTPRATMALRLPLALLLLAVLAAASAAAQQNFIWTRLPVAPGSPVPSPRGAASLGFLHPSSIVLFGGTPFAGGSASDETWVYNLGEQRWTQINTTTGPSPRAVMSYGTYYDAELGHSWLIVAHGTRQGTNVNDEIWAFSSHTRTWEQLPNAGDVPPGRYGAFGDVRQVCHLLLCAAVFLMGHGFSSRRYSDVYAYDLKSRQWSKVYGGNNAYTPNAPHARCLTTAAAVAPNRLVMYGGCMTGGFTGGTCPSRDAWVLGFQLGPGGTSPVSVSKSPWSEVREGPSPRNYAAMVRVPQAWGLGDGLALLLGGEERGKQTIYVERAGEDDIEVVDTNGRTWLSGTSYAVQSMSKPGFRSGVAAVTDDKGGRVFVFGGGQRNGSPADSSLWVLTYEPVTMATAEGMEMGLKPRPRVNSWFLYIHLHGLFMGLSWGVLLPCGVLLARHLKHLDPLWFKIHRAMQATGVLLSLVGLILVFVGGANNPLFAHGVIGVLVVLMGLFQPLNAYFRPHKGEKWRRQWEWVHKGTGRLAVLGGLTNVSLGVFLVNGPNGLWIAWFVLLGLLLSGGAGLEVLLAVRRRRQARLGEGGGGAGTMALPMKRGAADANAMLGSPMPGEGGKAAATSSTSERAPSVPHLQI